MLRRQLHCQDLDSLRIPCCLVERERKNGCKSVPLKQLSRKFPQFIAPFPGVRAKSRDYGQILQKSWPETEKFPAKFPAAGNYGFLSCAIQEGFFPGADVYLVLTWMH